MLACLAVAALPGAAQEPQPGPGAAGDLPSLAEREASLAERYRNLERSLLRLADLMAASDPQRAALLRSAFERSSSLGVGERLEVIASLLEEGQFIAARSEQTDTLSRMKQILDLLESGDSDRRRTSAKEEIKAYLQQLDTLISRQREIGGSTESGGDAEDLAERQESLGTNAEDLAAELGGFADRMDPQSEAEGSGSTPAGEGQPQQGESPAGEQEGEQSPSGEPPSGETPEGQQGEGQQGQQGQQSEAEQEPPIEGDDDASRARRTQQRLQAAQKRMEEAGRKLEQAKRDEATEEQEQALAELENARAELEEILRQLREEEVERLLVQLETRLRKMLRMERGVLAGLEQLTAAGKTGTERERELEAVRLGREQQAVAAEAMRALLLVRDDGSAVAIPEALEQVQDDATQAGRRLERNDTGASTQALVRDLVVSLEEILDAVEKVQREQEQREQQQGQGGGRPADPGEQPLVDKLSELKMLRTLQMRINSRTRRYADLLADGVERAEQPELLDALDRLSRRQRKIERAAHDIVSGRTE